MDTKNLKRTARVDVKSATITGWREGRSFLTDRLTDKHASAAIVGTGRDGQNKYEYIRLKSVVIQTSRIILSCILDIAQFSVCTQKVLLQIKRYAHLQH